MATLEQTETTWAWLAGLIDGDGSICIGKTKAEHGKGYRSDYYRISVVIYSVSKPLIDYVSSLGLSGSLSPCAPKNGKNRRPLYRWTWNISTTVELLQRILPYSVLKKEQCKIALEFCQWKETNITKKKEGGLLIGWGHRKFYSEEEMGYMDSLWMKMRLANGATSKRGMI